jgi:hypothetical protein
MANNSEAWLKRAREILAKGHGIALSTGEKVEVIWWCNF